jgi:hypothetical protein
MKKELEKDFVAKVYNENMTYRELVSELKKRGFKKGESAEQVANIAIIPRWKAKQFVKVSWEEIK